MMKIILARMMLTITFILILLLASSVSCYCGDDDDDDSSGTDDDDDLSDDDDSGDDDDSDDDDSIDDDDDNDDNDSCKQDLLCSEDGWCWSNPRPVGTSITDMQAFASDDVYLIGSTETVLHWGGADFELIDIPGDFLVRTIWGTDSDHVFIGGNNNEDPDKSVAYWEGNSWALMDTPTEGRSIQDMSGSSPDYIFVALPANLTKPGAVFHFNGTEWSIFDSPVHSYHEVWVAEEDEVYFVAWEGIYTLVLLWNGVDWTEILRLESAPDVINDIAGLGPNDMWLLLDDGYVSRWDGSSWSLINTGLNYSYHDMWSCATDEIFFVATDHDGGHIVRFDGTIWEEVYQTDREGLTVVGGSSCDDIYAAGGTGEIAHWDGSNWQSLVQGDSEPRFYDIWGSACDDVYAVGETFVADFVIYHFDGAQWSVALQDYGLLYGIWGSASDDVYAVGDSNKIFHWDGADWINVPGFVDSHFYAVWGSSSDDVFVVGRELDRGMIHHWDGSDWTETDSGFDYKMTGIHGCASDEVFAVNEGNSIFHYDGNTWTLHQQIPLSWRGFQDVWCENSDDVYVIGDGEGIWHWDGISWTQIRTGSFSGIWGTNQGDIYVSVDEHNAPMLHFDGSTWTEMKTPNYDFLLGVGGSGPNDVYAVSRHGTILRHDGK
jgi:hypothetical protein